MIFFQLFRKYVVFNTPILSLSMSEYAFIIRVLEFCFQIQLDQNPIIQSAIYEKFNLIVLYFAKLQIKEI